MTHRSSQAARISASYIDPASLSNNTCASMISGCQFETRVARPLVAAVCLLRRLTIALSLLLSILLLNLRGLLLLGSLTAG